ncbi:hypothetical protein QBC46DRAFT_267939 [Diplogelasinospora grovesii]|uniref:DUF5672 domain-containing protein n=1 Tax=Diplogelasinospora grovesii TaxID=303347 RepID=A0AAN6N2M1_9PEZI|nr:hypothetical protein QBC46DRAFT_267939 [Diplogelasinospora grovesii]
MNDLWGKGKKIILAAGGRTSRRIRMAGAMVLFVVFSLWLSYPTLQSVDLSRLPTVSLEYQYQKQASKFNESKVALLIENRPNPILAPLMLHFISVVPPDWRFRFMGSPESVEFLNKSVAIQEQVRAGKLDLTYIPSNMTTGSQEEISRFLTTLWLYEVVLQPAEWLLVFQTDSIVCANSRQNLNDYLDYDWVGAPWNPHGRFGGNGGLSLRRVSAIIDVLRNQERKDGTDPEDVWLTDRLGHRPGSKMANGTTASTFSGEMHAGDSLHVDKVAVAPMPRVNGKGAKTKPPPKYNSTIEGAKHGAYVEGLDDWRDGFYEPMGYHTGGSGNTLHAEIWGTPKLRRHIWEYCPEVKMTLHMDVAKFVPGQCNANWKRSDISAVATTGEVSAAEGSSSSTGGYETEVIDGKEYPVLPAGLVPW